jgi:hypothetical protein
MKSVRISSNTHRQSEKEIAELPSAGVFNKTPQLFRHKIDFSIFVL